MSETTKYAAEGIAPNPFKNWPAWMRSPRGTLEEIGRRRFLDRHHHLINPRFYTPHARASLDQLLARRAMAAEFMRVAKRPA